MPTGLWPAPYKRRLHIVNVAWTKTVEDTFYQQVMGAWLNTLTPAFHVAVRAKMFMAKSPPPLMDWLTGGKAWLMATASNIDPTPAARSWTWLSTK